MNEDFLIVPDACGGIPLVRVFSAFDMGWSQRSNGYSYDSMNGYGAIIGQESGKVLDYTTRNRKCRLCEAGKQHTNTECRLNFYGSAKSMEADAAVELVVNSKILEKAKVEVGIFIADNDSSSMAAIQKASSHIIIKQSDINHSKKGVGNHMYDIHKSKAKDPNQELSTTVIDHIKKCFGYAVKQNKGDVNQLHCALLNIPDHLFNKHENCGLWCHDEINKENSFHIRLKNNTLYEELRKYFSQLDAGKFISGASSQANESLNNMMCSKAPKNISYSTSESADYRFAATCGQKNYGPEYLCRTMSYLEIPFTVSLTDYVEKSHLSTQKRREKIKQPDYKKQRFEKKIQRSQLKYRKEKSEGLTYSSNMNLLSSDATIFVENSIEAVDDCENIFMNNEFAIVFFDIETGGTKYSDDILQISMKCGNNSFNSFITPTQKIAPSASKVNGLVINHNKLFQNGIQVETLPRDLVFAKILKFFHDLHKKCLLVAHNCGFDAARFIYTVQKLPFKDKIYKCIFGFSDTLNLFRQKFPKRPTGHKLTTLASELLSLSCDGAHDASFDVKLLEKLTVKYIAPEELIKSKKSVQAIEKILEDYFKINAELPLYVPMYGILKTEMIKRLIKHDITYKNLVESYKTQSIEKTISLLKGEVNGKPQIIKKDEILNNILNFLKLSALSP